MLCSKCGYLATRKEWKENNGCPKCVPVEIDRKKASSDLMTSFRGKGSRGFVQWLKKGNFLKPIEDEGDLYRYNDRCEVIETLIGPEKYDRLLAGVVDVVLSMGGEKDGE